MIRLISSIPPTWSKVVSSRATSLTKSSPASGPTFTFTPLRLVIISSTNCCNRPVPSTTPGLPRRLEAAPHQREPPVRRRQLADRHQLVIGNTVLIQQYDVLVERRLGLAGRDQRLRQHQPQQHVVRVRLHGFAQRGDPVVGHEPHFRLIQRLTSGGATHEYTQNANQAIAATPAATPRCAARNP